MIGERFVVVGAGGHAKVVIATIEACGGTVVRVLDDDRDRHGTRVLGHLVEGPIVGELIPGDVKVLVAVGANQARAHIVSRLPCEYGCIVHPSAVVHDSVAIGPGTVVFAGAVLQPDVRLGAHVIVNTGASVDHDCVVGDFAHVAPGCRLAGNVQVDHGAFLGIGAAAVPGAHVGSWATIGAGGVVVGTIAAGALAVGVPARVIGPSAREARLRSRLRACATASPPRRGALTTTDSGHCSLPVSSAASGLHTMSRVYLSPPDVGPAERDLLLDAFDSGWVAPLGPHVDLLEREFAELTGMPAAVALSSGTAAIHLGLRLLDVGPEDEVITSTLTFVATANAITYLGARPVFIDVDPATWAMSPTLLDEELAACSRRGRLPKAIVPVDLYGQCADYDAILAIAERHAIPVLEDAAEALGATYKGRAAGSFGDMGAFSFNGNKIVTTSGGGMLVSRDPEYVERARFLATQARDRAPHYEHSQIGYNYRMSNLLAAVGRGQIRSIGERVARRRANNAFYRQAFRDVPGVTFMPEAPYGTSNCWLTCVIIDPVEFGVDREAVRRHLESLDIESRPVWKPMHLQPVFASCRVRGGDVAAALFQDGLCLPSGRLAPRDLDRIVSGVLESRAAAGRTRN